MHDFEDSLTEAWNSAGEKFSKDELVDLYDRIGIARFFARVNAGIIPEELGHNVIRECVARDATPRGMLDKAMRAILG